MLQKQVKYDKIVKEDIECIVWKGGNMAMKNKQEPYFEFRTEHLFDKTKEEKIAEECTVIIEKDQKKAPYIIAKRIIYYFEREQEKVKELIEEAEGRARKEERQIAKDEIKEARGSAKKERKRAEDLINQNKELEKKCRRRNIINMIGCWLVLLVVLTLIFEYVFPAGVVLTVVVTIGKKALDFIVDFLRNRGKETLTKKKEKPDRIIKKIKVFLHRAKSKKGMEIIAFIMTVCLMAGVLAKLDAGENIVKFCQGGYAALMNSSDEAGGMVYMGISMMVSWGESILLLEQPSVTVAVETKRYLAGSNEGLIWQLDNSIITWEDINLILNLSEEDYNRLFFLEGIEPGLYESQEQLNQRVYKMAQVYTAEKLENKFDIPLSEGGPSQEILNTISRMSDLEKETIVFSETKDILIAREGVYQAYPKRTLAQLVSNGYHQLALLLFWHGGQEATVVYYYGQSIFFGLECLKFADNTGLTVKEKLLFIAQRYEDIAYTCPGFRGAQRARMLAKAFCYAADQY